MIGSYGLILVGGSVSGMVLHQAGTVIFLPVDPVPV